MVKLAISVLFAAALASVVAAQDAGAVFEDVNARDVAPSAESDLFGRAAAKVMSDLLSREELTELLGREVDGELSQRDIDELFEREVEVNGLFEREIEVDEATALAAREAAGAFVADVEARQEGEGAEAEGEAAEAAPATAPKESENKPKSKPKGKDVEAKPKVNKNEHSLFGSAMRFFSNLFNPKAKAAADAKKKGADAKAKTAPAKPAAKPATKPATEAAPTAAAAEDNAGAAPAEGESQEARDLLFEEPVERSFGGDDDTALNEARELMEDLEEVFGRDFELEEREFDDSESVFSRDFDDELLERDFDDNESVFSRDFDDNESVFSRDFDDNESVFSRDFDDAESVYVRDFNDELVEREFDFDSELAVRDFEDELLGREFDEAVLEQRDFDDVNVERGLGMEEWDEELLRKAFDVVQELEQLD